jgi:hypothetical protein
MAAPIERRQATSVARFARGDVHVQHGVSMCGGWRVVRAALSAAIGVRIDTRGRERILSKRCRRECRNRR